MTKNKELVVYDMVTGRIKMFNPYGNGIIGEVNVYYNAQGVRTDSRQYYFKDHLGSIRQVYDETATVVSAQDYYPYGEILRSYVTGSNVNDKYKFTEKERDTETNYDYFGARYFDSQIGRWLQVDPLADKYPGWSPYNYVKCDPLNRFDPDGKEDWKAFVKASVAGVLSGLATYSGFAGMVASASSEVVTGGTSTPVSIPAFLGSYALFSLGVVGLGESTQNIILSLETPDGMTAKQFHFVKEVVKGFGGNGVTQEGISLIVNAIGLKSVSKFDDTVVEAVQVLYSGGATAESIIDFIKEAASNNNNKETEQTNTNEEEEKEKNKESK